MRAIPGWGKLYILCIFGALYTLVADARSSGTTAEIAAS